MSIHEVISDRELTAGANLGTPEHLTSASMIRGNGPYRVKCSTRELRLHKFVLVRVNSWIAFKSLNP